MPTGRHLAAVLLLLVGVGTSRAEDPDEVLQDASAHAIAIFQQLVRADAGALARSLDPQPIRSETFARLARRGVPASGEQVSALWNDPFDRGLRLVLDGVAADLKEMPFEFHARHESDGEVAFFAHGEKLPREHHFVLRLAREGAGWRVRSFVQAISPLDLPELVVGVMVGLAARTENSRAGEVAHPLLEAVLGASALLTVLLWGASRLRWTRALRYGAAVGLWAAGVTGGWALMRAFEPPETRARRVLLALPEAPVFLALREGKLDDALGAVDRALEVRSGDPALLSWKAFALQAVRKEPPADLWRALLSYPPAAGAARHALVHEALRRGDIAQARTYLEPQVSFLGDNPYLRAKLLWMRARMGEMDKLEIEFLQVLARANSPMPILLFRAKSFAALGLVNRAFADLGDLTGRGQLFREMVLSDADLVLLQGDPRFADLVQGLPSLEGR